MIGFEKLSKLQIKITTVAVQRTPPILKKTRCLQFLIYLLEWLIFLQMYYISRYMCFYSLSGKLVLIETRRR